MTRAEMVRAKLEQCGVEYVVWLPDTETQPICDSLLASPKIRVIQVCTEDEALGIAAGLYMGGKKAAVMIQNSGFYNCINGLRGLIIDREIPLLLLIGNKGYHEMIAGKKVINSIPVYLEPLLDVLGIKHYLMDSDEEVENIGRAYRETMASNKPVAVVIAKENK